MKRPLKLASGLTAFSLLLAGCGDAPDKAAEPSNEYGDTIELASDFDPNGHFDWANASYVSSWDPTQSINGGDMIWYEQIYDRLLREDLDGQIEPMLASEFTPSEDGKTLTLTLQQGLKFSDGSALDAEAVKFNLDRARGEDSKIAGDLSMVESVDIVDEQTIEVTTNGAIGGLPTALATSSGIMVSPAAVKAGTLETKPIGIGPYIATNITSGDSVEFEKTPDYWDPDAQHVESMTYQTMSDDQTRMNALKSGEVDGAAIRTDSIDEIGEAGFTPVVKPSSLFLYLMLNTAKEPFDKPEVRRALNMSINREEISQGLYNGYCTPQVHPFPESGPGYPDDIGDGLDDLPYDPEQAKEMLSDAGMTEPLDMVISASNITIYTQFAEVIQQQLAEVGFDMDVHSLPPGPQVQEFAIDKTAETLVSMSTGINDPSVIGQRYLSPTALFNPGFAEYPKLDELWAEGSSSLDPAVRKPAYEQYVEEWIANPPHLIPVCLVHNASAYTDAVSGVTQRSNGFPGLRGVAVAEE
ncbi:MAG: ABC transporter substrate-binding protein [Cumulibacter sp.]